MRHILLPIFAGMICWPLLSLAQGPNYPEASLDQATREALDSLKIERLGDLDEEGVETEHEWALEMGKLCLKNLHALHRGDPDRMCMSAIEFQRHAGRTARYRGFGEQAIRDYELAIEYAYESAKLLPDLVDAEKWDRHTISRDIADTYFLMGAYDVAGAMSQEIIDDPFIRQRHPFGSSTELDMLADIAQVENRTQEAVELQRQGIRANMHHTFANYLRSWLEEHTEIGPNPDWADIVRRPEVEELISAPDLCDRRPFLALRAAYSRLARALRIDGRLEEAQDALTTAELTPLGDDPLYRENLDLWVDREFAFLALGKGEAGEALGKAEFCLDEYVMSPAEEIELLDLVSQAKEELGDLDGAMGALEAAIEIVETRRANLVTDEFKQSYAAGYAELYRRALDLAVNYELGITNYERESRNVETSKSQKVEKEGSRSPGIEKSSEALRPKSEARSLKPEARSADHESRATNHAFEWAERLKGRAMLDAINRYDKRMARAIDRTDTVQMKAVRDLTRKVVSTQALREAEWWPGDTALIEYAFGANGAVYVWAVSRSDATFQKLGVNATQIDDECARLSTALGQHGDSWVEPAAKLYEHTIRPIADRLRGIKQLVIVGDGKLRTVPFEVFISSENADENRHIKHRLLIEDYAISYAPSATTLQAISTKTQHADLQYTDALWAFASTKFGAQNVEKSKSRKVQSPKSKWGDAANHESQIPNHEPRITNHDPRITSFRDILRVARSLTLDDLPNTRREVKRIASLFPQGAAKTWIDQENMKQVLLRASNDGTLKSVRFLHFATHAFVDESRPYLCGLVLSPPFPVATEGGVRRVGLHPPVGELDKLLRRAASDGTRAELLTLHELAGLDLRSELVVLSACQSLGGRAIEGDWINGLARSFLIAGSSGVLCTLWETDDKVSSSVVPAIYHAILDTESAPGRIDVPRALQQCKVGLLKSPQHGHPARWASFIYHGRIGCEGENGK